MTQDKALTFVRLVMSMHGSRDGCQIIADNIDTTWETVYAWHRRGNVPKWRLAALERAMPAVVGAKQAAE